MTIYFINNKPYTSVFNGFKPIEYLTYMSMVESGEIHKYELIELEEQV